MPAERHPQSGLSKKAAAGSDSPGSDRPGSASLSPSEQRKSGTQTDGRLSMKSPMKLVPDVVAGIKSC